MNEMLLFTLTIWFLTLTSFAAGFFVAWFKFTPESTQTLTRTVKRLVGGTGAGIIKRPSAQSLEDRADPVRAAGDQAMRESLIEAGIKPNVSQ